MCAKNHINIFGSFLDIQQNAEWPRFFGPPGMQHSLNIPPHLKRVATLPCEMFMSENSVLISEIHLVISLHFYRATQSARYLLQ